LTHALGGNDEKQNIRWNNDFDFTIDGICHGILSDIVWKGHQWQ
jgi:hypothetical protein